MKDTGLAGVQTITLEGYGGAELAVHLLGEGRPLLLLHGLFSSAQMNWIRYGHAALLAEAGFACIMPDWRAHGQSAAPHRPEDYPPDVLVRDACALVEAMGLTDYDLAGFSLGARTAASGVIAGLAPRRLVLAGMGIEGLSNWQQRAGFFVDMIDRFDTIAPGDPAYMARQFLKSMGTDRVAARLLLTQGVCDIAEADLAAITMPALVLCGNDDRDNGSPDALALALPDAALAGVPGNHMGCVTKPDLGAAIRDFLTS